MSWRVVFLVPSVVIVVAGCAGGESSPGPRPSTQGDMAGAEAIRKQVYDLRPADLERFPIWEHALDEEGEPGQDEATVRPRPDLEVADPADGMVIARAELIGSDGTRYVGYVYPSSDDDPGSIQPTIATEKGQVNFWYGIVSPKPGELAARYRILGKTPDELFPLRFRALVAYKGTKLDGEIRGFMHYAEGGRNEVVEVR